MRKTVFLMFFACLLLVSALEAAEKADCTMCHPDKSEGKIVHPAVSMGCSICHIGVDASSIPHMFFGASKGLPASGEKLCFGCHDKRKVTEGRVVHMPVSNGMCTSCHDPHTSNFKNLLVGENVCYNCHDKANFSSGVSVHAPVAMDMCLSCHSPHASRFPKLLKTKTPALCYECHSQKGFQGPVVHTPVVLGMCISCHSPHRSDNKKLTVKAGSDLCYDCHDIADLKKKDVHKQSEPLVCLGCHKPHVSKSQFLLAW